MSTPRRPVRGLRLKIIAWSFVPTALVLFAVALVSFFAYHNVTEQLAVERNRELGRLSAGQLASGLTEFTEMLESIARMPDVAGGVPVEQQSALTGARAQQAVFDAGIVILDPFGSVVAALPERPRSIGEDWSDRDYFRGLLRSSGPMTSGLVHDGTDGAPVVVIGVPILADSGRMTGAVLGMFNIRPTAVSSLYGAVVKLRPGGGRVYVLDAGGNVIYHSDLGDVGLNLSSTPLIQRVVNEKTGSFRTRDLEGDEVVAGFAPVPGTGWILLSLESWSSLMAPSRTYRAFLYLLLALGLVLPAGVVMFGVRRLTRPLTDLKEAVQEVAGGRFGRTIDVHSGDEIQELAHQFNLMSGQLQDSYAELERRVEDRTRELATLNAIAAAVAGSVDMDRIMADALAELRDALQMDVGVALLTNDDGAAFDLTAHEGMSPALLRSVSAMSPSDWSRWFGERLMEPVAQLVEDCPSGLVRAAIEREGIELALTVPLVANAHVLGVIGLGARASRPVSQGELDLLVTIGNYLGVAAENARMYVRAGESAAAAERNRLARDLHDAVSQTLFSASLIAEVLPRLYQRSPEEGERRARELRELTRGALAEMRALLLELRPAALQEAEVGDLLRQLSEAVTGRARVATTLSVQGEFRLPVETKIAAYRIAQEALHNVVKHAGASKVAVSLTCEDEEVRLTIIDDGRGFKSSLSHEGLGLGIMAERAHASGGRLEVESGFGKGTVVSVVWPGANGKEAIDD